MLEKHVESSCIPLTVVVLLVLTLYPVDISKSAAMRMKGVDAKDPCVSSGEIAVHFRPSKITIEGRKVMDRERDCGLVLGAVEVGREGAHAVIECQ